jgi:choline dehydrogenase-like flavoprotein
MIADLSQSGRQSVHHTDVCIIGAGAAGIAMAREFIGTSYSVTVLEGGGPVFEPASQEPYKSEITGLGHSGIHTGRARVLGGTTTMWAGQALPLFDSDFRQRDWVPYSGWPIEFRDLRDFYTRAERVMQVPCATYDSASWPRESCKPPQYADELIESYFSQFTHVPDFAVKYRAELMASPNITLLTHANVTSLSANEDASAIREATVKSFDGHECRVQARMFVICCGGIDTARLLLVSNSVERDGIGNRHDLVGRFFQDHPGVSIPVKPLNKRCFGEWYNGFKIGNVRHSIKLAASAKMQRKERILSVGAEVFYPIDDHDPIGAAKIVLQALRQPHLRSQVPAALAQILKGPHKVARAAFRHYVLKQVASVNAGTPHIGFGVEQQPNPQSRVTLSNQVDCLGVRRTRLEWKVGTEEGRSIDIFARTVAREMKRLGVAEFDPADLKLTGRERGENGGYIDASHHMGTTRMGSDPAASVVNSSCRVHDYDNLYIGSSSVFPTCGFSNPTLTMLALCLRISDELKVRMSHNELVAV